MTPAIDLLQRINNLLDLSAEGLALITEIDQAEEEVKTFLIQSINKESTLWRKFDKWKSGTHWKTQYIGKYADAKYASMLESLKDFLVQYLEESETAFPDSQKLVRKGQQYTGSMIIRHTFLTAKTSIKIQDNFIGLRILDQLENVLDQNNDIEVYLLTKSGKYKDLKPFIKEYPLFQKQFPKFGIKSSDDIHGRFIIIDNSKVFSCGASIKDFGKKADVFSEILDSKTKNELMRLFDETWASATLGVEYV